MDEAQASAERSQFMLGKAVDMLDRKAREKLEDLPDVRRLKKDLEKAAAKATSLQKEAKAADDRASKLQTKIRTLGVDLDSSISDMSALHTQSQQWKRRIGEYQAEVQRLKAELEELGPPPELQTAEMAQWSEQRMQVNQTLSTLESQVEDRNTQINQILHDIAGIDRGLANLDNVRQQRLHELERKQFKTRQVGCSLLFYLVFDSYTSA